MRRYRSRSGRHLVAYISALLCMQRGEVETKVCSILCGARNHCLLSVVRSGACSGVPASSAQLLQFRICGPEAPAFCLQELHVHVSSASVPVFLRLLLPMLRICGVADAPERLILFEPAQHVLGSETGLGIGELLPGLQELLSDLGRWSLLDLLQI